MDAIAADWIVPVTSAPIRNHAIEWEDGIIRALRPARESDLFLKNACILPGLVNAHTHLAYTGMRNLLDDLPFFSWIRKLTEIKLTKMTDEQIAASTRMGIYECIRSGITTVADMSDL